MPYETVQKCQIGCQLPLQVLSTALQSVRLGANHHDTCGALLKSVKLGAMIRENRHVVSLRPAWFNHVTGAGPSADDYMRHRWK